MTIEYLEPSSAQEWLKTSEMLQNPNQTRVNRSSSGTPFSTAEALTPATGTTVVASQLHPRLAYDPFNLVHGERLSMLNEGSLW